MSEETVNFYQIRNLKDQEEKEKALQTIIKRAQEQNDIDLEYEARTEFMQAVAFTNQPEKSLACFPWLLAMNDKHPGKFWLWELFWYYKWVVNEVAQFPSITKQRIMDIMEDMERRYVAAGYGTKTIVYFWRRIYQDFGEPELAKAAHEKWEQMEESSSMSDCSACVRNHLVSHHYWMGEYQEAIDAAEDLLNKKMTCKEVPKRTYHKVVDSYIYLGRLEEAIPVYKKAVRNLGHHQSYLKDYSSLLIFLSLTENFTPAKNIFVKQLQHALVHKQEHDIQLFYIACLFFLKILQAEGRNKIVLPETLQLPVESKNRSFQINDLIPFFDKEIDRIANLFNERNGNDYFSHKKDKVLALVKFKRKVALK